MATQSDWKATLGFTDRLIAIQSITTAYRRASPSASFAEAQSQAKRYENEAYEKATSKEEYDELCQKVIDEAEATDSVAAVISSPKLPEKRDEEETSEKGIDIGQFKNCIHHEDGLQSTIYKSKTEDGRLVALKVTTPHLMTAPHDSKREIRILREAAGDHVIPLLESFTLGGRLILVFPFMRHVFQDLLHGDILTVAQIKSHLRDLFHALAHVHSQGIIHRDVKPSNILLASPAGPAYLADFGIAWKEGDPDSEPPDQKIIDVGTTCYRPPEILFGSKTYDTSFDLWSAGCVVAEAIDVNHKQLFDSGPIGSELSLISSIFQTLGTPNEKTWPECIRLPDWGKMEFYEYPPKTWEEILKGASSKGRDLVSKLVCYETGQRISATEALHHPFLTT
ncbi:protein kinase [Paecilomyces variotii]|uniref:cyclin-dependent kinase n=1 Tax=Byssochlamys spectabilis TaxID=264951 RepID=A0A443HVB8_BYSSP|nr:protein kinase [Paecilomyces variotii]KAJ9356099.1 hypothetical protein DTO280E4_6204 [Paecilomyces variotii]RWQ95783.1 protein kinase [Paecilomyces variotii]